jgi:hypothetical protein
MKQPNPLPASAMTPLQRRAELCAILARGVLRMRLRDASQIADHAGESSLHIRPDESVCHRATDTERDA